jgi:hypothetical protein
MNDLLKIGKREQGQCCCRVPFDLYEVQVAVVHYIGRKTRSPDCSSNDSFKFIVAKSIRIGERRRWYFGVDGNYYWRSRNARGLWEVKVYFYWSGGLELRAPSHAELSGDRAESNGESRASHARGRFHERLKCGSTAVWRSLEHSEIRFPTDASVMVKVRSSTDDFKKDLRWDSMKIHCGCC